MGGAHPAGAGPARWPERLTEFSRGSDTTRLVWKIKKSSFNTMPSYKHTDDVKSGVPLGGIGAGKIEILPNGLFNAFTIENNWSSPINGNGRYPGILGYHLGFSVESQDGLGSPKKSFLLQTAPLLDIPRARSIHYEGIFPRAVLNYECPVSGLDVSLEAFSPWIPSDAKHSALPCVFFNLKVKNRRDFPMKVGFIFMGRNLSGDWCVGRRNQIDDQKETLDLEFQNVDPSPYDSRNGALRFSFLKEGWGMSYLESWNAVTKNFCFDPQNISMKAWDLFVKEDRLPDLKNGEVAQGENQELCGAIAASQVISGKSDAALSFTASWYFPKSPLGHQYQNWFKSAGQVSRYVSPKRAFLRNQVKKVEEAVFSLPFPGWFNDALLTNLAPFFSSTWYVKDGRFAFYEAPVVCPLMGTLDVGFYGSIPLSYFFPELELSQITQFAKAQREDGYIPHDLGRNRLDIPSNGTTFYQWKDLNSKFILMVYRDYLWSGNLSFLKSMFPHVQKAADWVLKTDKDGNGLPDDEGADQTFDLWEFHGTNAYTSSLFLAALLACEKIARILKSAAFAKISHERFLKGSKNFEKELWNGKYFGDTCSLSQLNGQWYADLLGLGTIADPQKIKKALETILSYNSKHSLFGMVNSVCADKTLDISNDHSKNVWSGMNYAFMSLCIFRGFGLNNLLKEAHKIWDNLILVQRSPWNLPDTIDSKTGQFVFGDSYYRNMAIWSIPIAFARRDKKTAAILESLKRLGKKGL
jgi:uncharacterized protein (DUF608 family)